ncbi:MAG: agmatinase [Candidatus Poribacteria bacterium]|nr:MAG: agmatinase [Candidatus Poribacteria bacterium]
MEPSIDPFLGLSEIEPERADVILVPVPFERTVSYGTGTAGGPQAILEASEQLETFDEETLLDFEEYPRVWTDTPIEPNKAGSIPDNLDEIAERFRKWEGRFVVGLGGEHLITYGILQGLAADLSEVTVVQIDAHADLIERLEGDFWSHGTVMRRLWESGCRLVQIGVRSLSREEYQLIQAEPTIQTFFAHRLAEEWESLLETLRGLEGPVFLSLDVDGLDPSILPSTGTPQPDGLSWRQTLTLLRTLFDNRNCTLLGADVVEFVPSPHPPGCDLTAAKLVMKLIAYWAAAQQKRSQHRLEP